jgi:arylsulfatase A-like enzyme
MWATFAELAGGAPPDGTDGISIVPALTGTGTQREHETLYWEYHSQGGSQAVRMGRWKAVRLNANKQPDGPLELYDLERDPGEKTNVAAGNPEVVRRIAAIMKTSHTPSAIPRWNFGTPQ